MCGYGVAVVVVVVVAANIIAVIGVYFGLFKPTDPTIHQICITESSDHVGVWKKWKKGQLSTEEEAQSKTEMKAIGAQPKKNMCDNMQNHTFTHKHPTCLYIFKIANTHANKQTRAELSTRKRIANDRSTYAYYRL